MDNCVCTTQLKIGIMNISNLHGIRGEDGDLLGSGADPVTLLWGWGSGLPLGILLILFHVGFFLKWSEIYEPLHDKTNKMTFVPREDSDQSWHPPSLIRVLAVRMKKHRAGPQLPTERSAKTLISLGNTNGSIWSNTDLWQTCRVSTRFWFWKPRTFLFTIPPAFMPRGIEFFAFPFVCSFVRLCVRHVRGIYDKGFHRVALKFFKWGISHEPLIRKHSYLDHRYLEGQLSFHDSWPQGPCPRVGLEVKI